MISGNFRLDKAATASAKATYLSAKISAEKYAGLERYKTVNFGNYLPNPKTQMIARGIG